MPVLDRADSAAKSTTHFYDAAKIFNRLIKKAGRDFGKIASATGQLNVLYRNNLGWCCMQPAVKRQLFYP